MKSEPRSPSPSQTIATAAPEDNHFMRTSSTSPATATMPVSSLISAMIDTTEYAPAPIRGPSVPHKTTIKDEQVAKTFATGAAAFNLITTDSEPQHQSLPPDEVTVPGSASANTVTNNADDRFVSQNDMETASTAGASALSPGVIPVAKGFLLRDSRATSLPLSTSQPRSDQHLRQIRDNPVTDNAKSNTPNSLYPGPSTTMPPPELQSSSVAKKRTRTGRSENPERFLYAGNTFSNLDDSTFHETAENNPYLSQLTVNASRPVYKTPQEARQALKEVEKPSAAPINYDQQIKELTNTIADFRKKYEKTKVMTVQAGIQVAGNVWDRLANIVQYPPDFDAYAQKGQGELGKYAEEMKAWDRAIGHQVIIKKRIVYREAIEKLQVKLDIVQAEKDLDGHNAQLKRKAAEAIDDDD